jgi:Ca-activated chloride channel family protein
MAAAAEPPADHPLGVTLPLAGILIHSRIVAIHKRALPGLLWLAAALIVAPGTSQAQSAPGPVFRSGVDLVSVAAVVRDGRGRVVRGLGPEDFVLMEAGRPRPIVAFAPAEEGPVSVALLVDVSGSMAVARHLSEGRKVLEHLLAWLNPGRDEVAVFTFDRELREEQGFTTEIAALRRAFDLLEPWGSTALYDAIGETAKRLADRPSRRRAIVVLTDGLDTISAHTPSQISGLASAIDVPVYVVAVMSDVDRVEGDGDSRGIVSLANDQLFSLAWWTGGNYFAVSRPAHASDAARTLLAELRHQYVLAFESSAQGWLPLDVKLRKSKLTVRARSGHIGRGTALHEDLLTVGGVK